MLNGSEDCGTHGTCHSAVIKEGLYVYCFTRVIFELDRMYKWDGFAVVAALSWSSSIQVNELMLPVHCYMQIRARSYGMYNSSFWGCRFVLYDDPFPFPSSRTMSLISVILFLLYGPKMRLHIACQAPSLPLRCAVSLGGTRQSLPPCPCVPHLKHLPEQMLAIPGVSW